MDRELEYKDFSKTAKKGINKFARLSSKNMIKYGICFKDKTGKNPYDINLKEEFYSFVAKNKIRRCK